jgi:hypothetical protein
MSTTIDTILEHFRKGRITRGESVAALARMITRENVAEVMAALPEDVAADVQRWLSAVPAQGGIVLGANISGEEGKRIAADLRIASQAVREWAARRGIQKSAQRHDGQDAGVGGLGALHAGSSGDVPAGGADGSGKEVR